MSKLSTNWKDTSPSHLIKLETNRAKLFDTVITQDMVGKLSIYLSNIQAILHYK